MKDNKFIRATKSTIDYYISINNLYFATYKKLLMLHYPLYKCNNETLEERQINLTNFCLEKLNSIKNKVVLDVGCGNGIQSRYIFKNFHPSKLIGVDINPNNIELAKAIKSSNSNLIFLLDDAQSLSNIGNNSIDILVCIESGFHFPDKSLFIKQINRVLKDDGVFIIADIILKSKNQFEFFRNWGKRMSLNHWSKDRYLEAFKDCRINVEYEFITKNIIKGYLGFYNWITYPQLRNLRIYLLLKGFLIVQVFLNVFLLHFRREYILFFGKKQNKQ